MDLCYEPALSSFLEWQPVANFFGQYIRQLQLVGFSPALQPLLLLFRFHAPTVQLCFYSEVQDMHSSGLGVSSTTSDRQKHFLFEVVTLWSNNHLELLLQRVPSHYFLPVGVLLKVQHMFKQGVR